MRLRTWLHILNIDRRMYIAIDQKLSDGRIVDGWSSSSVEAIIMSPLGSHEIVQAKITEKGNLWILIK